MKERPILFSAPMVRALLDGSKTQTRRVVKPQPERRHIEQVGSMLGFKKREGDGFWLWPNAKEKILAECFYGQPGDRLWVREGFAVQPELWEEPLVPQPLHYLADIVDKRQIEDYTEMPPLHMPRWASRITLEVTGVRLERLQDISEADARAEGIECLAYSGLITYRNYALDDELAEVSPMMENPIDSYRSLWESINGPGSWDANPWVWAIEFKKV